MSDKSVPRNKSTSFYWNSKTPVGIRLLGVAITFLNFAFIIVVILAAEEFDLLLALTIISMAAFGSLGILLALSHIYLSVDTKAIHAGLWPLSKRTVPVADLRYDYIQDIRPSSFNGVGFRGASGNRTAYLWGRGPGLELHTAGGESVTVVFEDAAEAARVLEDVTNS